MTELPEGVILPTGSIAEPRPSAAAVLSRGEGEGLEILLCHRVSEVPAFPDFWAFPGGGISLKDRAAAEENPGWLAERKDRVSMIALLREMVEEVGIAPDGNGGFFHVGEYLQDLVNSDKSAWSKLVASGELSVREFEASFVSQRTTPPLAPIRFSNIFYHVNLGSSKVEPTFPTGLSEFDEFRWWKPIELLNSWLANKVKLAPPQVTLIRDIVDLGFESLAINPPSGYHIIEFAPGVECVPLPTTTLPPSTHTNCYVLGISGGPRILVDPAAKSSESLKILGKKVSEIHDSGSEIIATVFTHKHPDHIGDLSAISQFYQAPIWASQETLDFIPNCDSDKVLEEGGTINLDGIIWNV
ncbi:MAG TPA: MBL fold metallo-hydrolase, partial [Candidatus Thalassarchaeaceae archaeon]|nr:MBL fold metallo-hydrolase [Candidatus Thalassarchaeaceae archaeon]